LFRVTRQMERQNRDDVGRGCVKDVEGKVSVEKEKALDSSKAYYAELTN